MASPALRGGAAASLAPEASADRFDPRTSRPAETARDLTAAPKPGRRKGTVLAAVAAIALAGATGLWIIGRGSPETPPASPPSGVATNPSAPPTNTPPTVPGTGTGTVATPPLPPASAPPLPPAPVAAPAPVEFSRQAVLDGVFEGRDPTWTVDVKLRSDTLRIQKDKLQFRVSSARAGYLYILQIGTDSTHFWQLFPNSIDRNNRVEANRELVLPRPSWPVESSGPAGINRLVAIVTPTARDFSSAGLQAPAQAAFVGEFDIAQARAAWTRDGAKVFAGKPINCALEPTECVKYGAAKFTVREVE